MQAQDADGEQPDAAHTFANVDPYTAPSAAAELSILRQAGLRAAPAQQPLIASQAPALPLVGQPGVDGLVNNPALDVPESTTQSETTLAVRGDTLCAGFNDSGANGFSGLSRSSDLGGLWVDQGGLGESGDPVIAVHQATGVFYYAELANLSDPTGVGPSIIGVARSTDDCQTFGPPVDASPRSSSLANTTFIDKPWIAVDNTNSTRNGNVYVCFTRFINNFAGSELRFSSSHDGGLTYQENAQVLSANGTAPFGCSVGIGPRGDIYVVWADRDGATIDDIRFRRSIDGGATFSPAISLASNNRHPGSDRLVTCGTGTRPTLNGDIRMLHQAWLSVDTSSGPFSGNLYVVWASDPLGAVDNSDVFFSRSTNEGLTWSTPVQLGAGGGATDQFEPFVAVGGAGTVTVAWYDRRNDPANNRIDVYKTFSQDGGASFGSLERVTDASFPVPPINPNFDFDPTTGGGVLPCYMGEYIAIAGDLHNFYYLWGDNRNTVTSPRFPSGRPDPDVFFEYQPAPVAPTADLVVEAVITATNSLTVVVKNAGAGSVPRDYGFWVDVYINPNPPPTQVNETWDLDGRSSEGLVWGVDGSILPLQPGEVITLTIGDQFYWPTLSKFSGAFPPGASVYVQVDSASTYTSYGGILETHELLGGAYNNISDRIVIASQTDATLTENVFLPLITGGQDAQQTSVHVQAVLSVSETTGARAGSQELPTRP